MQVSVCELQICYVEVNPETMLAFKDADNVLGQLLEAQHIAVLFPAYLE